jgi:hypothetical protein
LTVPEGKRTQSKLSVQTKAIELATYTITICSNEKNFPKRYRWCLTSKIVDTAIEIISDITGVHLNSNKTQTFPLRQGINFLGFKFKLTKTGKVIRLLDKKNIKKRKRKLRKLKELVERGKITKEKVDKCHESWKAHAGKGNSYNLLKRMDFYYENLWKR